jgi:thiol-disulfide isomerase/thioredoxin
MKTNIIHFLILILTLISCSDSTSGEIEIKNKPSITFELDNQEDKELIVYSPSRFYSQKIKTTNTNHLLNFYVGELVLIYDSENSNYKLMNGVKKGAIFKILEQNQTLKGRYTEDFEHLEISSNFNDLAIRNYFQLLKEPYSKIFKYPFDFNNYKHGIIQTEKITDSILRTEINDNTKINILMSQLQWNHLSKSSEEKYLSKLIDTLKVSELLLTQYKEKRNMDLVNFGVGDTVTVNFLESFYKTQRIDLNKLDKKVNILFFTAKWCGPCRNYIKPLARIKEKYPSQVEIIGIDFDDNEDDFESYKKNKDFRFVSEFIKMKESKNSKAFNINSLPRIIIIDSNKKVLMNRSQSDFIEKEIDAIIKIL